MEIDKVKELVRLMVDNELSSISIRNGGEEITLRRPGKAEVGPAVVEHVVAAPILPVTGGGGVEPQPAAGVEAAAEADADADLIPIRSPMVGTYYSSANPDASSFVQVGDKIRADSVVCIIEAMKVFNEIRAEVVGVIERILVGNEEAIEYGQPLFLVRAN